MRARVCVCACVRASGGGGGTGGGDEEEGGGGEGVEDFDHPGAFAFAWRLEEALKERAAAVVFEL